MSTAVLTNNTGIELQLIFSRSATGKLRYINNLYIPNTEETDWDLETVVNAYGGEWEASDLGDLLHEDWQLRSVKGRVRGDRPDAGMTYERITTILGTVPGLATPDWLTYTFLQEPDNVNRLVLVPGTTIFRKGRISLPPPPGSFVDGNNVTSAAVIAYNAIKPQFLSIPAGGDTVANPGFSLCMTRVAAGVLRAKCNVLSLISGEIGTQLTARD